MKLALGLIGDPVAHSLSPAMQRAFLAERGLEGSYEALRVPAGACAARVEALRAAGYHGLNVTTPLKEEAYARADTHDDAARASGAVNTLVLGPRIAGYNTDGLGALGALAAAGMPALAGRRVLILGAGPTARACVVALAGAGARVMVWNRTLAHAERLVRAGGARFWVPGATVEAAFSTLPPGAHPSEAALLATLAAAPVVVDANYGARATLGAMLGRADVHDGTAMLRASARAAFEIFIAGARPASEPRRGDQIRREGDSNSRDL